MSQETKPTPEQITAINSHLDALLGMDVRKPGSAAKLPAVIRITEELEGAGGKRFPVYPPSYAGEGTNAPPVYDLNGIEWGEALRVRGKDDNRRIVRYIKRAHHCTMDSPQSHANRTEIAFRDDEALRSLVPQATAKIPRKPEFADQANANLLALPHRVADFRVRASDQKKAAADAIKAFSKGDALPLLRFMPTSIIFGFWDSRAKGYQHKHSRILLTRIDAFGVVPCEKHALYIGPYSKDECAEVVLGDPVLAEKLVALEASTSGNDEKAKPAKGDEKKWGDEMAARGFSNALSKPGSLGGIFADRIERLALISLTDIATIFCFAHEGGTNPDRDLTNAARRYILALALLAEGHPRATGSYRLRSGCELLGRAMNIELLGAGKDSRDAASLKALCENRDLLIEVARAAHQQLGIPPTPGAEIFESTKQSLKIDLEEGSKSKRGKGSGRKSKKEGAPEPEPESAPSTETETDDGDQTD